MVLFDKIQEKREAARAREKIRPLLDSRMMRDILLEISQRGTAELGPQSVPLDQRARAAALATSCGFAGMKQSVVDEVCLDETSVTLVCGDEKTTFRYAEYNYEDILDTDCLPAVAQYLVQHMRGYYNISRTFYMAPKPHGKAPEERTRAVFIRRHHEETPFAPGPVQKQRLF